MGATQLINGLERIEIFEESLFEAVESKGFKIELTVVKVDDLGGRREGATLWVLNHDSHLALAWDWFEAYEGVLALANPVAVVSNLNIMDRSGKALTFRENLIAVNKIVNGLCWQESVAKNIDMVHSRPDSVLSEAKFGGASYVVHWAGSIFKCDMASPMMSSADLHKGGDRSNGNNRQTLY